MNSINPETRAKVIAQLQRYSVPPSHIPYPEYTVCGLAQELAPIDAINVWMVIHDLARIGVVIPGNRKYLSVYANHIPNHRNEPQLFNWPFFTITEFGREYLKSDVGVLESADDRGYVAMLKTRMPDLPDVVATYSVEAKRAFDRGLWLGTSVMLGVAAEALIETTYEALGGHLLSRRAKYEADLKQKESSAKARYEIFSKELQIHRSEFDKDLWLRRESLLDPLTNLLKANRDDVAHRRTTRIDRDSALASINSFPAMVQLVRELNDALSTPCTVTS